MIAAAQARQSLEQLGLAEAAAVLDGRLEAASQKQLPYADFLADLLSTETAARRERYLRTRTRLAHLPFQRTLDQFDFRFQPSIDKRQVRDLATLTFISEAANVLFLGPPGVGKTHLAIALGLRAIEQGSGVYFVRAHELLEDLRRAQAEHRLERRLRIYLAPKLLIIDEFGVWPYDRMAATAFFTLVSARYERGSIILTSNKGFAEWGRGPRRQRHRHGDPRSSAAPQPRAEHPRRELPLAGEEAGWAHRRRRGRPVAARGRRRQRQPAGGGSIPNRRRWVKSTPALTSATRTKLAVGTL